MIIRGHVNYIPMQSLFRILVFLVCFGVFLGAVGLYKPIFEAVGCGISVPLIGFGGTVAEGVKESVDSFGLFGVLKGPFTAAAPAAAAQPSSAASQIDLSDGLDMKELMSLLGSSQPQPQQKPQSGGLLSALFGKKPTQPAVPVEADNSINGTALLQALLANR